MSCFPYIRNSNFSQNVKDRMHLLHTDIYNSLKSTKGIKRHSDGFLYIPAQQSNEYRANAISSIAQFNKERKLITLVNRSVDNKIYETVKIDVTPIGEQYSNEDKFFQVNNINLQKNDKLAPQYSESNKQQLLDFLYKVDPNFKVELVNNLSVNALLDLKNALIQIQTGKESALTEEVAHVFVEMLDPKLKDQLKRMVTDTKIYNETFNQYKDIYTKNGRPDIDKIKREASAKLLAQAIYASTTNDWTQFNEWKQIELTGIKLWIRQFMDWIMSLDFNSFINYGNKLLAGETDLLIKYEPTAEDEIYYQLSSKQLKEMSVGLLNYNDLNKRVDEAAEFINRTLNNLLRSKSYDDLNKIFGTEEGRFLPKQLIETTRKFMHNVNLQSQVAKNFIVTIDRVKDFIETLNRDVIPAIESRDSDKVKFKEAASVYASIREWKVYLESLSRDLVNETGELKDLIASAVSVVTTAETKLINIFQAEVYEYFKEDIDKANDVINKQYDEQIEKIKNSKLPNKDQLVSKLENEKLQFLWDKKRLTQLMLGHTSDLSVINTMVVGASSTDDPVIALFRKNLDKVMLRNRDESIDRINSFKKKIKIEDLSMTREEIGRAITKEESELRYNPETETWEEKTNRYFLNPVNNKAYIDAAKLRNNYMEAKRKYKDKLIDRKEYFKEKQNYFSFIFKNWNQAFTKEFYEKNFLYNASLYDNYDADVVEYLQEKIDSIWDRMAILDTDIDQNGGIPTIEQEEERSSLMMEYKFLRNPYNIDGTPKIGIDLEAQKIMSERFNWKAEQDFYDFKLNDAQFLREFEYQVDLVDKEDYEIPIIEKILKYIRKSDYDNASLVFNNTLDSEESASVYPAISELYIWFKKHTVLTTSPEFYEERKQVIDEIEVTDQRISQILGIQMISLKDTWQQIFNLVAPYRDKDGVVNAQLMPKELIKTITELEKKVSDARNSFYQQSQDILKSNILIQSELDELFGNKKTGDEGLFQKKSRLIAELDEFQTREVSDYWISEFESLDPSEQAVFAATTLTNGKPKYIWSKQIKKKSQYQKVQPTGEFFKRTVKDKYKTEKITFAEAEEMASQGIFQKNGKPIIPTVDDFGNWIPITMDNSGTLRGNAEYVNQEYFNLKNSTQESDKKLFKVLSELTKEYVATQLKLDKNERLNYKVPQKVSDIFENPNFKARLKAFTQNLSEKGEGNALLNVVNEWSVLDEVKGYQVDIPLKYSQSIDNVTVDVLESVFEFIEGAEMKVKLHEELPIVQAIEASLSVNPIPNQNRLKKFKGIIDRDFKGQTKAYELGGGKTGKKVDNIVRGIMGLTAITRLSIFNPQNNIKNYLAATINTWVNFSSKDKLLDSVITEAYGWANKNLALFMVEGMKSEHDSFEYKLIEYFSPDMKNKFKNYLPGQVKDAIQKGSFLMSGIEFGEYMNTVMTIVAYLKAHKAEGSDKSLFDEITLVDGKISSPTNLEDHRLKIREYLRTWQGNVGSQREAIELDKYTLGSMALFFKRWLIPALRNNYGGKEFNFVRNEISQGYWRTVYGFLLQNFKTGLVYWRSNWDTMNENERKNLLKALKQASILLSITGAYFAMGWDGDDKDRFKKLKASSWAKVQLLHLTMSVEAESSALSPLRLNEFGNEIYKHFKNPFLFLGPLGDMFNAVGDLANTIVQSEDARYKRSSGKNKKGELKLWNRLMKLTPFGKTEDFIDKERSIENIRNFQQLTQRIN